MTTFNPTEQLNKVRTFMQENNMSICDLLVNTFHLAHENQTNYLTLITQAEELFWEETNRVDHAVSNNVC